MKIERKQSTASTTITPKQHKDIPGNPSTTKSSRIKLKRSATPDTLRVLTLEDWEFWKYNGYVVIKKAVPGEQVKRTRDFLWEFEDKDPDNPKTWYTTARAEMKMKELVGTGMVEVYNNQYLWDNRQMKYVYDAFVDIWGTEKLWVSIDRANLNFPNRRASVNKGFIHWDYDPGTKPQNVQGVLALSDQTEENIGETPAKCGYDSIIYAWIGDEGRS